MWPEVIRWMSSVYCQQNINEFIASMVGANPVTTLLDRAMCVKGTSSCTLAALHVSLASRVSLCLLPPASGLSRTTMKATQRHIKA